MDHKCTVCNIVDLSANSFIVYEDELFISFLDIKPLFLGHCLLAPKQHFSTIYDLPISQGNQLLAVTQKIGNAITKALHAEGTFIAINNKVSQSIPHLHIHLVPRKKGDGLKGFFWPRTNYVDEDQMREVQVAIISRIKEYEN